MKDHHWVAVIVGTLSLYLLIHTAMAAYGIYLAHDILQQPPQSDDQIVSEIRDQYHTVVAGLAFFSGFGLLSVASSIGLGFNVKWGQLLWLGTSAAIVNCIVYAVVVLEALWRSHYLYVLTVVCLSWWALARVRRSTHEG